MLQLTSRRFLRELDEAPGGKLGGNGGRSGVMCKGSPYMTVQLEANSNDP